MQLGKLKFLACPKGDCFGTLRIHEGHPILLGKENKDEISEGFVSCEKCGEMYPILKGILMLLPEVWDYLAKNFLMLKGICEKYGGLKKDTIKTMMSFIPLPLPKQIDYDVSRKRAFERESQFYLLSHYGDFLKGIQKEDPLFSFLKEHQEKSPHLVLEGFLKRGSVKKKGLALEIGCNVGGFVAKLSSYQREVFGIDKNFEILILARKRLQEYGNMEVLLADALKLPFKDQALDLVASSNCIDIVEDPEGFLKEKLRVLKKKGRLLMAAPYVFNNDFKYLNGNPKRFIKKIVSKEVILENEKDPVCWIYKKGDRHYEIFYTHCLSAIKVSDS